MAPEPEVATVALTRMVVELVADEESLQRFSDRIAAVVAAAVEKALDQTFQIPDAGTDTLPEPESEPGPDSGVVSGPEPQPESGVAAHVNEAYL